MIPQNFKDILSNGENGGLYQILALILFMMFFIGLIFVVFKKPKKYYRERENAPLEDGEKNQ
ncbi:CcoQ/FixQ family Cbb3-type cytochrome c oxidase assembly chaperone [Elizabethkingia argentiflava]|uniref:CcoQ/FixQ family Cbb3-type cytochrome c oxidase assembly chaperone n=1 Tax=Elizabethkingia argenteiflava TaxID=2681556 RepID=A0A845Q0Q8_9FLAO|nr:CcoQ/FixQ family Cbb3-type cytochrome c oxidase assembly chaperone [Elizabethkingia argenteiflava]NAW52228.1 CcoQ/FixQ family Cbb3-type cytochrome c oxidase assembly chaperone [Elizabethkingia argenteiflava]